MTRVRARTPDAAAAASASATASDARWHPARTVVPVLPTDTAADLAERYPWFVPELTASALDRPAQQPLTALRAAL